jgi:GAG-pre-integrase domain
VVVTKERTLDKWHRILGHVNIWTIRTLKKNNLVTGLQIDESEAPTQCSACIQGKRHVDPFPQQAEDKVKKTGDVIVSDVWGPAPIEGLNREKYFYSFTDVKTQFTEIYLGTMKDEVLRHFESFKQFIETQTGNILRRFRSDNGREYVKKSFKDFVPKTA